MLALLFDPRGRIESGPFLKAVLIILAVQWGLGLPGAIGAMAVVVLLLGLLSLPFTYALICVWVKRLRGAGRSGWWVLAVLLACFILGMLLVLPVWLVFVVLTFGDIPSEIRDGGSLAELAETLEARRWVLTLGSLVIHTLSLAIPLAVAVIADRELTEESSRRAVGPA
ncbi:MAG: DUF805 domain-containing protein [Oceanicaulis sp.]